MSNKHLYQHFRAEESYFIDHLFDLASFAEDHYMVQITEFLTP